MRCYYVLVEGRLEWLQPRHDTDSSSERFRPAGFYCHRYVLASSPEAARDVAFRKVRANLDSQTGWLKTAAVRLELVADEIARAASYRLLLPDNRGHIFYDEN